jgi:hypothetical protein
MKKRIKFACIVVVAVIILLAIGNKILLASSYSYACWRVNHPFGPDVKAFDNVVSKTEPMHIPILIAMLDSSDAWWVESILKAFFPNAQPPEMKKKDYWTQWWMYHNKEHGSSLILDHDPNF